jgi:hypothetical protein
MAEQNLDIVIRVRGGQVSASEIQQVGKSVGNVGTQAEATSKKTSKLRGAMTGLATGFAVYKGYQFIKGAVSETVNLAKATAGLQRITGMDTATASGWVGMAKERGIQSKQLNQGFITLAKNISSAAGGSKTSAKAFAALGLDAANLKVQDSRTQLGMIADSFKALPAGVDKAALAQKLFGRQSQALLPLLNAGAKGLNEQVDASSRAMGMTGKTAKAAMQLAKQQRELNATMTGLKVSIATALLPVLTALAKAFLPLIQAFTKLMTQSPIFRFAVIAVSAALLTYVAAVNLAKITTLEFIATAAPWLALAVAIGAAFVLLYRHSAAFRNILNAVKDAGLAAFRWIKNAAIDVFHWILKNWPLLLGILTGPIGLAIGEIITHWTDVKNAAKTAWNFLKSVGAWIGGAFTDVWNTLSGAVNSVAKAIGKVVGAAKSIASLPGKALKALGNVAGGALSAVGSVFAEGGTVGPSGTVALVGERGPEIVALPGGSNVIPNHRLGSIGGGGAHFTIPVYLDRRQVGLAMGDYVADKQAAR